MNQGKPAAKTARKETAGHRPRQQGGPHQTELMDSRKKSSRRSFSTTIMIVILIAAIGLCAYSAYNVFAILAEDASSDEMTATVRSFAHAAPAEPESRATETGGTVRMDAPREPEFAPAEEAPSLLEVDFAGLQELNSDICAWIDIPGTNISYPVTQTDNNDYYLSHSFDGSANRAGAIFLDERADAGFGDRNTIIYGHRMNNGSMFGSLHKLADPSYRENHQYIHVYLPGRPEPLTYEILATWETPASLDSAAYQVDFPDDAAFSDWLDGLRAKTFLDGVSLRPDDRILTLSTCVRGDGDYRFVVAARLLTQPDGPLPPAASDEGT